jgi:hypothetical protein
MSEAKEQEAHAKPIKVCREHLSEIGNDVDNSIKITGKGRCKVCKSIFSKKYRILNSEKIKAIEKASRLRNAEARKEGKRKYYLKNKEHVNYKSKIWRENNKEKRIISIKKYYNKSKITLNDSYIKNILRQEKTPAECITSDYMDTRRKIIEIRRFTRGEKHVD